MWRLLFQTSFEFYLFCPCQATDLKSLIVKVCNQQRHMLRTVRQHYLLLWLQAFNGPHHQARLKEDVGRSDSGGSKFSCAPLTHVLALGFALIDDKSSRSICAFQQVPNRLTEAIILVDHCYLSPFSFYFFAIQFPRYLCRPI